MRKGSLWLLLVVATAHANESRPGVAMESSIWGGLASLFPREFSEPGMMVALAAATVLIQFVRKYRVHAGMRRRMLEYGTPPGGAPTTVEGLRN